MSDIYDYEDSEPEYVPEEDNFVRVLFNNEPLNVTYIVGCGLAVYKDSLSGEQYWLAYKNEWVNFNGCHKKKPSPKQVSLAIKGYAAYLDNSLVRPAALDQKPNFNDSTGHYEYSSYDQDELDPPSPEQQAKDEQDWHTRPRWC